MTPAPLDKNAIVPRIQGIQEDLEALRETTKMPLKDFAKGPYFGDANYRLHRILEGVFNIGNHLLSRLPGAAKGLTTYRDIALKLGEKGIVSPDFAQTTLVLMASYRNRLVHGYADVTPQEIHSILCDHLADVEQFLKFIKAVIEKPETFGFEPF